MAQIDEVKTVCARLASTNEENRALCRENVAAAWLSGGLMRLCLQHSEMQRGWRWSRSSAPGSRSRSLSSQRAQILRGRQSPSIFGCWRVRESCAASVRAAKVYSSSRLSRSSRSRHTLICLGPMGSSIGQAEILRRSLSRHYSEGSGTAPAMRGNRRRHCRFDQSRTPSR